MEPARRSVVQRRGVACPSQQAPAQGELPDAGAPIESIRRFERTAPRSAVSPDPVLGAVHASLVLASTRHGWTGRSAFVAWFEANALPADDRGALPGAVAGIAFLWFIASSGRGIGRARTVLRLGVPREWVSCSSRCTGRPLPCSRASSPQPLRRRPGARCPWPRERASLAFSFCSSWPPAQPRVHDRDLHDRLADDHHLPRAFTIAGYVVAVVMLLSLSFLQWIVMLFPLWSSWPARTSSSRRMRPPGPVASRQHPDRQGRQPPYSWVDFYP